MYTIVSRSAGHRAAHLSPNLFNNDGPAAARESKKLVYMVGAYFSPVDFEFGVPEAKAAIKHLTKLAMSMGAKPYWHSWSTVARTAESFARIYGKDAVDALADVSRDVDPEGILNPEWCAPFLHRS